MAQDALKPEYIAPVSDVVQSESVAEGVEADAHTRDAELLAQSLETSQNVTLCLAGSFRRGEHQGKLV